MIVKRLSMMCGFVTADSPQSYQYMFPGVNTSVVHKLCNPPTIANTSPYGANLSFSLWLWNFGLCRKVVSLARVFTNQWVILALRSTTIVLVQLVDH